MEGTGAGKDTNLYGTWNYSAEILDQPSDTEPPLHTKMSLNMEK